jgi:hypothetical protein
MAVNKLDIHQNLKEDKTFTRKRSKALQYCQDFMLPTEINNLKQINKQFNGKIKIHNLVDRQSILSFNFIE